MSAADSHSDISNNYRGRFAPSPTGPLHLGSLISAVASYCQAKKHNGTWLVRMEDIDSAREQAGAADDILKTLEAYGLHWDESVSYQSQRHPLYEYALDELRAQRAIYPCACSRKEIQQLAHEEEFLRYPGTCRNGISNGRPARALRVKTDNQPIEFEDLIQGHFSQYLNQAVGDFVLKRADGLYAYQLAVVIDDAEQRITEIVRGADLLDNTPRQRLLQSLLSLPHPQYAHVPIAVNSRGEKLSKQTRAAPIQPQQSLELLIQALAFLGQSPPPASNFMHNRDVLDWAVSHWRLAMVPREQKILL